MSLKRTRSSGSTSRHYTRTPTRVSRAVERIGAFRRCHRRPLPTLLPTLLCQWLPCPNATPAPSTNIAVIAAVAALQCRRIPSQSKGQTAHTISTHQCTTATTSLKAMATTTWSSPSGRCTEYASRYTSNTTENFGRIGGHSWILALKSIGHRGHGLCTQASAAKGTVCFFLFDIFCTQRRYGIVALHQ
jgi:hypothetical protein